LEQAAAVSSAKSKTFCVCTGERIVGHTTPEIRFEDGQGRSKLVREPPADCVVVLTRPQRLGHFDAIVLPPAAPPSPPATVWATAQAGLRRRSARSDLHQICEALPPGDAKTARSRRTAQVSARNVRSIDVGSGCGCASP
jgi:hypothetical protein